MSNQDLLKNTLKNRKQRMTAQRELILRIFMESNGKAMNIDDVFMEIRKKRNHRTSKMTVKRAIDLLVELDILKKVNFENEGTKYEYIFKEKSMENIVFVCENCNKATSFSIPKEKILSLLPEDIKGFQIKNTMIKITGYCPSCSKALTEEVEEITTK